jgi:hypothetical protein
MDRVMGVRGSKRKENNKRKCNHGKREERNEVMAKKKLFILYPSHP